MDEKLYKRFENSHRGDEKELLKVTFIEFIQSLSKR